MSLQMKKQTKTPPKLLAMKTMVAEEKNILDEISSRLDMAEEKHLKK